ncbi:MAG: hypothetical protein JW822_09130 [Spirochaetales bacterium]|nr:hypothetical protein [Spirochaetales bacterium]
MRYRYLIFSLFTIVALFSCRTHHIADETNFITEANRVILANEQYFGGKYELWVPTDAEIQEALDVIFTFLKDSESDKKLTVYFRAEIRKILKNVSSYRVQFVGIIYNDRRYIHCNFVHMNSGFEDWREKLIVAVAGGFWYWYINYDAELKKVIKMYINGCT